MPLPGVHQPAFGTGREFSAREKPCGASSDSGNGAHEPGLKTHPAGNVSVCCGGGVAVASTPHGVGVLEPWKDLRVLCVEVEKKIKLT